MTARTAKGKAAFDLNFPVSVTVADAEPLATDRPRVAPLRFGVRPEPARDPGLTRAEYPLSRGIQGPTHRPRGYALADPRGDPR